MSTRENRRMAKRILLPLLAIAAVAAVAAPAGNLFGAHWDYAADLRSLLTAAARADIPVIPTMSTGATDSRALRGIGTPCYGLSGFFLEGDDNREHGREERIPVQSFFDGQKFLYLLVKRLSS